MERDNLKEVNKQTEYTCTVSISGYPVNIYSEFNNFIPRITNKESSYAKDIPGWKVDNLAKDLKCPSIYLLSSEQNEFYYEPDENRFVIKGNPEDFIDGQVLAYVAFWLSEGERQKQSVFTAHSSCFTVENKGVLLLGDGGSGKTAVALEMCKRYNCEFISNDLSIVEHDIHNNKAFLVDGSKIVRLRQTTVQLNFPELIHLFTDRDSNPWTTKIPIQAKQLGLNVTNEKRKLDAVFTIHLDSNPNQKTIFTKIDDIESQFCLYENLSRIVRGSAISVFDRNKGILGYMPSLDSKEIHQNRVNFINFLSKEMGIWSISGGNLNEICGLIKGISTDTSRNN